MSLIRAVSSAGNVREYLVEGCPILVAVAVADHMTEQSFAVQFVYN